MIRASLYVAAFAFFVDRNRYRTTDDRYPLANATIAPTGGPDSRTKPAEELRLTQHLVGNSCRRSYD
jgi:hypothetical protein